MQSPPAVILEPKKIKSDTVSTVFSSISHEVMGPDAMILAFTFFPFLSYPLLVSIKELWRAAGFRQVRSDNLQCGPVTGEEPAGVTLPPGAHRLDGEVYKATSPHCTVRTDTRGIWLHTRTQSPYCL